MKKYISLFVLALATLSWVSIPESNPTEGNWDLVHVKVRRSLKNPRGAFLFGQMFLKDGRSEEFGFAWDNSRTSLDDFAKNPDAVDQMLGIESTAPSMLKSCLDKISENSTPEALLERVGKNVRLLPEAAVGLLLQQGWEPLSYSTDYYEIASLELYTFRRASGS